MGGKNSYESIKRYQDKAYDRISIVFPKGHKDKMKEIAGRQGKSLNAFVVEAVNEKMERENDKI